MEQVKTKREYYLDVIRIVAMICVVMVHVDAMSWYQAPYTWYPWFILNIFDSIGRVSVPLFVMISGYLFLDPKRTITVRKIYTKSIPRILCAFFFWSFLYALITSGFLSQRSFRGEVGRKFLDDLFYGHYHMWYLFVILGLYMVTPVLRAVAADEKALRYFLILSFALAYAMPTLQMIPIIYRTKLHTNRIDYAFVTGYAFFYLFGYYIASREQSKRERMVWYLLSIAGMLVTWIGSSYMCMTEQYPNNNLHECLTMNVALYSCGAFVFFKYRFRDMGRDSKACRIVQWLSEVSFGVYLVQDFGMILMKKIGLTPTAFFPGLSVPILTLLDLLISIAVVWVIRKIPGLKRYVI